MIKIGNTGIVGVYKGSTPITSIYNGLDKVFGGSTPIQSDEIILEADLNQPGASHDVYVPIAAIYSATGNESKTYFIIDWGDGKISQSEYTYLSVSRSAYIDHYYKEVGIYEVKISINKERQVDPPLFIITSEPAYGPGYASGGLNAITKIKSWGSTPTSVHLSGDKVKNLTYVAPDTFGVITSHIPGARDAYRPQIATGSTTLSIDNFAPKLTGISPKIGYSPNLTSLGQLFGHNNNISNFSNCISETANLKTIDELYWAGATELNPPIISASATNKLHTIKSMYWGQISLTGSMHVFPPSNVIRHLTIKNLGENAISGAKQYDFTYLNLWGQNSGECPNARQSLVDSLITYSSPVSGEVTLYLPGNVYNLLSEEEKSQIRAKGYKVII